MDLHDDFADDYYSYFFQGEPSYNHTVLTEHTRSWTSLSRPVLAILLRIGFILLHVGNVPVGNVNLIFLQNIMDVCCVTVIYFLLGYIIACSDDLGGVIGQCHWIGHNTSEIHEAMIGWQAVMIASAISTSGIVGRTHTVAYLVIAVVLAGLVQPVVIHWVWTPKGWIHQLRGRGVIFRDYAGSATVHVVGGLSALIGCLTLGRRLLRLRDIDEASVSTGSGATVFAGQLLIFLGLLVNIIINTPPKFS